MAENVNHISNRDYLYRLLGCDELSSEEQILAEYKIKAKALHPDKNSSNEETTQEFISLTKAKDILCDEEQRKKYDFWRLSDLDISFEVWLKTEQVNHMSMHWAPQPKKKKMIRSCYDETPMVKNKTIAPVNNFDMKTISSWERKSSWGDSKLSRFRNYKK